LQPDNPDSAPEPRCYGILGRPEDLARYFERRAAEEAFERALEAAAASGRLWLPEECSLH